MEIIIAEKIHKSLEMNSSATKFINEINQLDEDVFIINFEGTIPGASEIECGNYSEQNLNMAKFYIKKYKTSLEKFKNFKYT